MCFFLQVNYILDSSLPQNCEAIILYVSGIILNDMELEEYARSHAVCAFFPQIPDVTINKFVSTGQYKYDLDIINTIIETASLNHNKSKCLMLFSNFGSQEFADLLIAHIKRRYYKYTFLLSIICMCVCAYVHVCLRACVHAAIYRVFRYSR